MSEKAGLETEQTKREKKVKVCENFSGPEWSPSSSKEQRTVMPIEHQDQSRKLGRLLRRQ
jgi:hypothetical protein